MIIRVSHAAVQIRVGIKVGIRVEIRVKIRVASISGDWGGEEGDSAERAGGSRGEPGIDAGGVEGMGAGRKEAELVIALELREADGAVCTFFEARHDSFEGEDRELLDGGTLQPRILQSEELLELSLQSR